MFQSNRTRHSRGDGQDSKRDLDANQRTHQQREYDACRRVEEGISAEGASGTGEDVTTKKFIDTIGGYIRWYNEKIDKMSLGTLSPLEYRQSPGLAA